MRTPARCKGRGRNCPRACDCEAGTGFATCSAARYRAGRPHREELDMVGLIIIVIAAVALVVLVAVAFAKPGPDQNDPTRSSDNAGPRPGGKTVT